MAKKSKTLPQTKMARTQIVGKTATKMATKKVTSEARAFFLGSEKKEKLRKQTREELAKMIFDGLVQLRGTALKLAQLLVSETGLLPEEYSRELEKAQYRVPPLSSSLVRSILRREMKIDFDKVFKNFQWEGAHAASLGQVHRAELTSGETVAVKVQYPGIQDTLVSDFELVKKVISPLTHTGLLNSTLEDIQTRLEQEIDYKNEAQNLKWFSVRAPTEGLLVPKVYESLSSERVLVMDYVEGIHLDQWIEQNQDSISRNEMARKLFRFFKKSVFEWGRLHSDPHFGNFLVTPHGALYLIDFGSVKTISPGDQNFYRLLWQSPLPEEALLLEYEARGAEIKSGGVKANQDFFEKAILPYTNWIGELQDHQPFDFKKNDDFIKRGYDIFSEQMFNPAMQDFSDELAFVHRTLLGYLVIFKRLGAVIAP